MADLEKKWASAIEASLGKLKASFGAS